MKRTRRAALAMIAGSSGLLAAESLGYSRGQVDRDISVDAASDDSAYLGLIDHDETDSDGVTTRGLLFEDDPDRDRYPPAVFDVVNQLSEPIDVALTLTDDRFRFEPVDGGTVDSEQVRTAPDLEPGTAISTAISLHNRADWPTDGRSVTTALEIEANGGTTRIEAERTLTLTSDMLLVIDLCSVPDVPDVLITVRKRRSDGAAPSLLVERIDCTDGTVTVLYETPTVTVPPIRLTFPDATATEFDPDIVAADTVSTAIDRPSARTLSGSPEPEPGSGSKSRSGRGKNHGRSGRTDHSNPGWSGHGHPGESNWGRRNESDSDERDGPVRDHRADVSDHADSTATTDPTVALEPETPIAKSEAVHRIDVPLEE